MNESKVSLWCETHSATYNRLSPVVPTVSRFQRSVRGKKLTTDPKYWTGTSLFDNRHIETYKITAYNCFVVRRLSLRCGSPLSQERSRRIVYTGYIAWMTTYIESVTYYIPHGDTHLHIK